MHIRAAERWASSGPASMLLRLAFVAAVAVALGGGWGPSGPALAASASSSGGGHHKRRGHGSRNQGFPTEPPQSFPEEASSPMLDPFPQATFLPGRKADSSGALGNLIPVSSQEKSQPPPHRHMHGQPPVVIQHQHHASQSHVFTSENCTLVMAQTGSTPMLHCEVGDIGEGTVSWIRRKDYHLLTVGLAPYSSDDRFFTAHVRHAQDWALHIRHAQAKDAGLYECQVSTHPPTSLFVELQIVEARAEILGGPDKHVKSGSVLRLTCLLRRSTEPPVYVFWYRDDRMINYDANTGVLVRHGRHSSDLEIRSAKPADSGNYSCVPSNAKPASIHVHILNVVEGAALKISRNPSTYNNLCACGETTCMKPSLKSKSKASEGNKAEPLQLYTVVHFICDKSVEVVPNKWIIENDECYWPVKVPARKMINEYVDPQNNYNWIKLRVQVFGRYVGTGEHPDQNLVRNVRCVRSTGTYLSSYSMSKRNLKESSLSSSYPGSVKFGPFASGELIPVKGEKPAAMQHGSKASAASAGPGHLLHRVTWIPALLLILLLLLMAANQAQVAALSSCRNSSTHRRSIS